MSIERSFYKATVTKTEEGLQAKIQFNPSHKLYTGHFPGNPITPGVCLIQSVNDSISTVYTNLKIQEVKRCKFTAIHNPTIAPEVTANVTVVEKEDGIRTSCVIENGDQIFVKYSAEFH